MERQQEKHKNIIRKDFTNYYHIALKSANETKYWLTILFEKIQDSNVKNKINELLGPNRMNCQKCSKRVF